MIGDYIQSLREAAKAGYTSFMTHIEPNLPKYILRRRFHISCKPAEGPSDPDDEFWHTDGVKFFGCANDEFNVQLILQWFEYRAEWKSLANTNTEWFKGESNYHFWNSRKSKWPDLVNCALWYSNWPTSSICAERTFALGFVSDTSTW